MNHHFCCAYLFCATAVLRGTGHSIQTELNWPYARSWADRVLGSRYYGCSYAGEWRWAGRST